MSSKFLIILTVAVLILINGCGKKTEEELAIDACIKACKDALALGKDLSNGPCLLNPIKDMNWVCDVAHWPRKDVDNLEENQCSAWREAHEKGQKMHFVEVTPSCEFIRAI